MLKAQCMGITFTDLSNTDGGRFYSIQSSENGKILFFMGREGDLVIASVEKLSQNIDGEFLIPHPSPIKAAFNKLSRV